jgi:hypothetical protein
MNDKYLLHIINEIISVVGLLKKILYIYKCRKIITSDMDNSCNYSRNRIS